jgi:hypothetical protein
MSRVPPPRFKRPKVNAVARAPSKTEQKSFEGFLVIFQKQAQVKATNLLRSFAAALAKEARRVIDEQRYDWKELTAGYLAYKKAHGLSTKILVATKFYYDHISWWMDDKGVHVGVPNIIHPTAKISLGFLARIHEFGYGHVPPRPLWRPLIAVMLKKFPKYREAYFAQVKQATRRPK